MAICCKFKLANQNYVWMRWFLVVVPRIAELFYKYFMRILGPLMFITANFFIVSVTILFRFVIMPSITGNSLLSYFVHSMMNLFLFINIMFNYYSCAFTAAGSPPHCDDPGSILGERTTFIDGEKAYVVNSRKVVAPFVVYKYCEKCECIKPPRAHHCRIVDSCILDMDHYCPWMNNCVGHYNYRYFLLFLVYVLLGASYIMIFTVQGLGNALIERRYSRYKLATYSVEMHEGGAIIGTESVAILFFSISLCC
jgi:palmitoyltransferase